MTPAGLQLVTALGDLGLEFVQQKQDVAAYVQARAKVLRHAVGEPGYADAVKAEAMNVALFALGKDIEAADEFDQLLARTFETALAIGVRVLLV